MEEREKLHGAVLIPAPSEAELNQRQFYAYRDHRRDLIRWMHDSATRGSNVTEDLQIKRYEPRSGSSKAFLSMAIPVVMIASMPSSTERSTS